MRSSQIKPISYLKANAAEVLDHLAEKTEARVWLQKWADFLDALTVSNVVPLRAA